MPTRVVRAGLLTAITDGLFSSVLSVAFYSSTVQRLFQGVASTLLGPGALNGGWSTALVGIGMHVAVAFGWSAVFLLLVLRWRRVRETLGSPYGVVEVAAVYGPFVWMVMSFAVTLCCCTGRPRSAFAGGYSSSGTSRSSACRLWP
jgi:hypothetical protein